MFARRFLPFIRRVKNGKLIKSVFYFVINRNKKKKQISQNKDETRNFRPDHREIYYIDQIRTAIINVIHDITFNNAD